MSIDHLMLTLTPGASLIPSSTPNDKRWAWVLPNLNLLKRWNRRFIIVWIISKVSHQPKSLNADKGDEQIPLKPCRYKVRALLRPEAMSKRLRISLETRRMHPAHSIPRWELLTPRKRARQMHHYLARRRKGRGVHDSSVRQPPWVTPLWNEQYW